MIQGYFIYDKKNMTEEEIHIFIHDLKGMTAHFSHMYSLNGDDLFQGIIKDTSYISSIETYLEDRKLDILGLWNQDGTELGTKIKKIFDEEGNLLEEILEGEPEKPFKKSKIEQHLPEDELGNKIYRTYAGFEKPVGID